MDQVLINRMCEGAVHTTHGPEPLKPGAASSTLSLFHLLVETHGNPDLEMAQEMMKKDGTKNNGVKQRC